MSIFSSIRRSRRSAKEHKEKVAEQKEKEANKQPYRHVPTHAATDAIASAPPSWREADRQRIIEENRRRSAMIASGAGHRSSYMPGMPRVGSSLSHVSYPHEDISPMVRMPMPRAYSYSGVSPYHYPDRNRDINYSTPDGEAYTVHADANKGKSVDRASVHSMTPRISPTFPPGGEQSSAESSTGSSSSQDDLEMRPQRPAARPSSGSETPVHRLHPSRPRRVSDTSIDRLAMANSGKASAPTSPMRDSRPPPSTRGFSSIPSTAEPPRVQPGTLPGTLDGPATATPTAAHAIVHESLQPPAPAPVLLTSRESSSASLPGLTPSSSRLAISAPVTPAALSNNHTEFPLNNFSLNEPELDLAVPDLSPTSTGATSPAQPPFGKFKDHRAGKTTRFTELERIKSSVEHPYLEHPHSIPPPPVPQEQIVNVFPEAAAEPEATRQEKGKGKGKRLQKGGGKLVKKNRMSKAGSSAVAA